MLYYRSLFHFSPDLINYKSFLRCKPEGQDKSHSYIMAFLTKYFILYFTSYLINKQNANELKLNPISNLLLNGDIGL